MPNLLLLSSNPSFAADLSDQIKLYAKDFVVSQVDDNQTFFDIIILDDKPELIDTYQNQSVPIFLLLSDGADSEPEGVTLLNKPISLSFLLDKIKSGIHLHENTEEGYLQFGSYELRPLRKEIYNFNSKEIVKLTEKEVSIIKYLYKAQNRIVGKNELLQEVWGYSPDVTTHTIETHIYRLRQKVEQDNPEARFISTSDGGYQLDTTKL